MVYLAESLEACLEISIQIESGQSVSSACKIYVQRNLHSNFSKKLHCWLSSKKTGQKIKLKNLTPSEKQLLEILQNGLDGLPILNQLHLFEKNLIPLAHQNLDQYMERLPFILLIPLLLFEFPAILLLLIGPLFVGFKQGF